MVGKEQYSRDDCLTALRKVRTILGESPSRRAYASLDISPSPSVIYNRFGSWDDAKRKAGLEPCKDGRSCKDVDSRYFRRIDGVNSAYWLGFLFGDGSIMGREYSYRVQLTIHNQDEPHLRRFKQAIGAENELVKDGDCLSLRISDAKFAENLIEKGFTTDKSYDGALPDIDSWDLKRAFVRGLADADGYFGDSKFTITDNTSKRLERLRAWIPVDYEIVHEEIDDRDWAYLRSSGKKDLLSLYTWLFPDGKSTEPALGRKKDIAVDFIRDQHEEVLFS